MHCSALMIPQCRDSGKFWNHCKQNGLTTVQRHGTAAPLFDAVWAETAKLWQKKWPSCYAWPSATDYREDFFTTLSLRASLLKCWLCGGIQQRAWRGSRRCHCKGYPQWPCGDFEAKYAKLWMLLPDTCDTAIQQDQWPDVCGGLPGWLWWHPSAMASHSSKSVVWYAKINTILEAHTICDVLLDKVENRGIARGKAEGEDTLALLMKKLFDQNRIEDAKRASEDKGVPCSADERVWHPLSKKLYVQLGECLRMLSLYFGTVRVDCPILCWGT